MVEIQFIIKSIKKFIKPETWISGKHVTIANKYATNIIKHATRTNKYETFYNM